MSKPHSVISLAVCHLISKTGSVNYLEVEYKLGIANGMDRLCSLRQNGQIKSLPKQRGVLKRYALTEDGARLVARHLAQQEQSNRNVMTLPKYVPPKDSPARRGAMDAFSIASRGISP